MTIADIIRRGKGSTHAWRVERATIRIGGIGAGRDVQVATLVHYGTPMLTWNVERPNDPDALDWSTGWGSVSDQNGMNTAFRVLGLPYRFDRDQRGGGPRVTELTRHPCGHVTDPSVTACTCSVAGNGRLPEQTIYVEIDHPDHARWIVTRESPAGDGWQFAREATTGQELSFAPGTLRALHRSER